MRERERTHAQVGKGQRDRETERENPKQAPYCQHGARHGARSHKPWDHDLCQSWALNWLSHPDAPYFLLFKVFLFIFVFINLTIMCLSVVLFVFIPHAICWASCIQFWKNFSHSFFKYFFYTPCLFLSISLFPSYSLFPSIPITSSPLPSSLFSPFLLFWGTNTCILLFILFLKNFYLFILRDRVCASRGRGREKGERESQADSKLSVLTWGSILWTMRSWLEPKSRVGLLTYWATQALTICIF